MRRHHGHRLALDGGHDRNGTLNGRRLTEGKDLLYGPTCNLAGCRAVFEAFRFDEAFPSAAAEDIEFCYRANRLRYRIAHCAGAVVEHDFGYDRLPPHHAWARFYREFRRYADGEPVLLERHPDYLAAFTGSVEIPVARAPIEPDLTATAAVATPSLSPIRQPVPGRQGSSKHSPAAECHRLFPGRSR